MAAWSGTRALGAACGGLRPRPASRPNIDHDLSIGGKAANLDVGVSYSRATGNMNQPAEYAYRKFLAFRGYGGPNCGVGVVADATSPSGMRLGDAGSAQPGVGDCMFYNPFGNGIEFSAQPGAAWENNPNPMYVSGLENSRAMLDWINEQVDVDNEAELLVAEATLSGNWLPEKVDYALGYQYRRLDVSAIPNAVGNYELNPCVVPGDRSCIDPVTGRQSGARAGAFTFSSGYYPYGEPPRRSTGCSASCRSTRLAATCSSRRTTSSTTRSTASIRSSRAAGSSRRAKVTSSRFAPRSRPRSGRPRSTI